jgi:hypothetical protein
VSIISGPFCWFECSKPVSCILQIHTASKAKKESDICYIDEDIDQLEEKQEEETGNFLSKWISSKVQS